MNLATNPWLIVIVVIPIIIIYLILQNVRITRTMKVHAKENGWLYASSANLSPAAVYLNWGLTRVYKHIITGTVNNLRVLFYVCKINIGIGKNNRWTAFTVGEFKTPSRLPHVIIQSRQHELTNMTRPIDYLINQYHVDIGEEINLEGTINNYFRIYIQSASDADIRQVLTPDVMAYIVNNAQGYSFETVDDSLFIFAPDVISTKEGLSSMQKLATDVIKCINVI